MTEHSWQKVRGQAVADFGGEFPNEQAEGEIVAAFRESPALIEQLIEEVAESKRRGKARSGWAVLRARVARMAEPQDVIATDERERQRKIERVANWLPHAGLYIDREEELRDEVERMLRPFVSEELLVRFGDQWRELRPRGERAEAESVAYQEALRLKREEIARLCVERLAARELAESDAA